MTTVNEQVLEYIKQHQQASPIELIKALGVSNSSIHKGLFSLTASGQLVKTGEGRNTRYKIAPLPEVSGSIPTEASGQAQVQPNSAPPVPVNPTPSAGADPTPLAVNPTPLSANPAPAAANPTPSTPLTLNPTPTPVNPTPKPAPPLAPTEGPEDQGFLVNWCKRLKLKPESVIKSHDDMYEEWFGFPYGAYRTPGGMIGKAQDFVMWVIAIVGAWLLAKSTVKQKIFIGCLITAAVGFYFYAHHHVSNELAQTRKQLQEQAQHASSVQNELDQSKAQLAQQQSQAQEQQKNLEEQIKALQQNKGGQLNSTVPTSAPVDYDALVQHPLSNASNTMNFFKGLFKPKAQNNSPQAQVSPLLNPPHKGEEINGGNQEIQTLRQQIAQLQNQNKQIQEQWQTEFNQTKEQLSNTRNELSKTRDQIEALTKENKRLNDRYLNEEGINQDLENKLKAVMAEKGQVSTEKDFSIQFDENGDRVK